MVSRRMQIATALSVLRARFVQTLERSEIGSKFGARILSAQFTRLPPRRLGRLDPALADLARPLRFPQRGRGSSQLHDLPPQGDADLARLIRSQRARRSVTLTDSIEMSPEISDAIAVLAASGAPLHARPSVERWRPWLGDGIADELAQSITGGAHGRERHSIRLRRAGLDAVLGRDDDRSVTVLLATQRPDDLPFALAQIGAQSGCRPRVLLGLHGDGWPERDDPMFADLGPDAEIARFDRSVSLGEMLNDLTELAGSGFVAKWDDDDWYGRHHLADLARAHDYSGADIVGKAAEFVYLGQRDVTMRRFDVGAETYSYTLAGGAMLTTVEVIRALGGWPNVRSGVDHQLLERAKAERIPAYRTHGFQYVLRRRVAAGHTWGAVDDHFAASASATRPGLDLGFADIDLSPMPVSGP